MSYIPKMLGAHLRMTSRVHTCVNSLSNQKSAFYQLRRLVPTFLNIDRLITYTAAEIAKAAGLREDQVVHRLRHGLGAAHGIGHNRDDAGVITILLPEGVPAEALVAGEAKAVAKPAKGQSSRVAQLRLRNGPAVGDDGGFFRARAGKREGVTRCPAVTPNRYPG
jgi:hypothetical protein